MTSATAVAGIPASFDRPFGHRVSVGKGNFGLLLRERLCRFCSSGSGWLLRHGELDIYRKIDAHTSGSIVGI